MDTVEFGELCRICGSKTSVLMGLHIFEKEGDMRQIFKKITECLPIQVHTADRLPKMVCEECVYKLDLLYEFREKSLRTECELKNMLKQLEFHMGVEPISLSVPIQVNTQMADTVLVQCVNPPLDFPLADPSIIKSISGKHSENLKCEPDVFVKIENNTSGRGRVMNTNPVVESESDSDDSESGSDSEEESSLPDGDVHDNNTLTGEVPNGVNTDNSGIQTSLLIGNDKITELAESSDYLLPAVDHQTSWFFCNICGKAYAKQEDFQAHYEYHWHKCVACGAMFTSEEALQAHKTEVHPKKTTVKAKSVKVFEVAVNEKPSNQLETENAKKPIENKKDLKPGEMKACTECGKEYRTNYKLAEHMRKHTGEKPYKCSTCEKAFRSKIGLAQHEAKHTGHYDYTCNSCGKGFQCKSYLIVHQRVHSDLKPYPCTTCGRNFKTKQSLLDHQNRHLGVKPYICETCGRGFITKGLCKSHQRVHSGTDNRQYPCTVCHKLFVSKSYLVTHLRIHTGEKPFMCEVCGKGFLTRVDLKIHSTMHTGEKSFVCEVCGKAFARRDALRCHRRSHTGERPYRCDVCGQSFTQFSPMAIHKRLHTGERPYTCDVCGKSFVSRSTMMSHRKKHTT